MAKVLYCRYAECGGSVQIVAGTFPPTCPKCGKSSSWSTVPGNIIKARAKRPRVPFDLTVNDRRFLKSIKIDTEAWTEDEDDGA